MNAKDEVVKAALLGTRQHPFTPPATGTSLDPLLEKLAGREPAQQLLDTLTLLETYQQAGPVILPPPPLPEPAAEDSRPRAPRKHLRQIVTDYSGPYRQLLGEWMEVAVAAGMRAPEELVVFFLQTGMEQPKLQPLIRSLVGPLGEWVARSETNGAWILPPPPTNVAWETGTLAQRCVALLQMRDADRGEARRRLDEVLPKENAEVRQRLLDVYTAPAVVPEDEEWLEAKLADRSAMVRRVVADRLALLPGSKLVERMKARLKGRLTKDGVKMFTAYTEDMARDGIDKSVPASSRLPDNEWWTMQAVASVPPSHWEKVLRMRPVEILPSAYRIRGGHMLGTAWRMAALRFRDQEWLINVVFEQRASFVENKAVLQAMDPEYLDEAMEYYLGIDDDAWRQPGVYAGRWSLKFSQKYAKAVNFWLPQMAYGAESALREAGAYVSLDLVPSDGSAWQELRRILAFRRAMREALLGEDGKKHGE